MRPRLFIVDLLYQIKFIKATRPRNMRTRPMLHEAKAKAEATKFVLEATLASRTLYNIPD